jgi:hypothetical protein
LVPHHLGRERNTKIQLISDINKFIFVGGFQYLCGMITLRDKNISMDQSYKIVNLTIQWCQKYFEEPVIKRRKELLVMVYDSPTNQVYGQYCDKNNWLTINLHFCGSVKDIIQTTIHEYTHFCQDLKEYSLMNKRVGYDKNPFEVEAQYNEIMYYKNCWRSIKNKL